MKKFKNIILITSTILLFACGKNSEINVLRLATTTSTYDSGLLQAILPNFEDKFDARVDVIAVGTGQAITLGEFGDVDVILVHAREREEKFIAERYGLFRLDVMYNDFVIVGPTNDPAGIKGNSSASEAFKTIASSKSTFVSRGDGSGTHSKELSVWKTSEITIDHSNEWYKSIGQGMGDTLLFANEINAYTLSDRGTYIALRESLPNLAVLFGGPSIDLNPDTTLFNPYSVIPVNPDKGGININLAIAFSEWITSYEIQSMIYEFIDEETGQPLFYPNSDVWNNQ